MRRSILSLGQMAVLACLVGCNGAEPPKPTSTNAPVNAAKGEPKVETGWGDVTGRIVWAGDPQLAVPVAINLAGNPDMAACQKNGPVPNETWIVEPTNKGLKNTFIWLEAKNKGEKLPVHPTLVDVKSPPIVIDQPFCAFVPHAVALREGQDLVVKNTSPIAHNYKWTGSPTVNPGGSVLMSPADLKPIVGLKADRLPIAFECNIHPWMKGWVRVYDHPYYSVSEADGKFTIKNAPAGEFRIKVWHGSGGWLDGAAGKNGRPITIKSSVNDLGDIPYAPP